MQKSFFFLRVVQELHCLPHSCNVPSPKWKGKPARSQCHKAAFSVFQQKHGASERYGLREQVVSQTGRQGAAARGTPWSSSPPCSLLSELVLHLRCCHTMTQHCWPFWRAPRPPVTNGVMYMENSFHPSVREQILSPGTEWLEALEEHLKHVLESSWRNRSTLRRMKTQTGESLASAQFFEEAMWPVWTCCQKRNIFTFLGSCSIATNCVHMQMAKHVHLPASLKFEVTLTNHFFSWIDSFTVMTRFTTHLYECNLMVCEVRLTRFDLYELRQVKKGHCFPRGNRPSGVKKTWPKRPLRQRTSRVAQRSRNT